MKKRLTSIEVLRILIMFFIIIHHSIVSGLDLNNTMNGFQYCLSQETVILSLLNAFVIVGVNVFFIISGYF